MKKTLLALTCMTALSTLPACSNYEVRNQLTGTQARDSSSKDTEHSLEVISLYGSSYLAQKDNQSSLGYSLVPYNTITEVIDESGKRSGIVNLIRKGTVDILSTPDQVFVARPLILNNEPVNRVPITSNGRYGKTARRAEVSNSEALNVSTVAGPEYNLKTVYINGQEMYVPFQERTDAGALRLLMVPREGSKLLISPNGEITIEGKVYELVSQSRVQKEADERAAKENAEAKKLAAEHSKRVEAAKQAEAERQKQEAEKIKLEQEQKTKDSIIQSSLEVSK